MQQSKCCALPLGDSPKFRLTAGWIKGFEPLASRATIWRANQLRYTHRIFRLSAKACLEGFEPPTHGLEGRCSIQLSYKHVCTCRYKAGDENRTHVSSLEGWCSTIELHLHNIGVTGFEPAASWSQTRRSSQTEPHPEPIYPAVRHFQGTLALDARYSI